MKFTNTLILSLLIACQPKVQDVFLGQGMMSGEATATSIILQSRLTSSDSMINGDLAGVPGQGRFEISQHETFDNSISSDWITAAAEYDHIVKTTIEGLAPGTKYYYRLQYGRDRNSLYESEVGSFKTLQGADGEGEISLAIVTGMNHYYFHYGKYDRAKAYSGEDKGLGYPALEVIKQLNPTYFIGTGDNVYFDHPNEKGFLRAIEEGSNPHPAGYEGKAVTDDGGMRRKYHEQFAQPRFQELFRNVSTYWEKDDHDYRFNDADTTDRFPISHQLGVNNFKEQLPVVDPNAPAAKTYRTHRMSKNLQIWLLEGRDFRSPNAMPDGPDKQLLGEEQLVWLKETLLKSDASFKLIISPTPLVGPDDAYKSDNHVNPKGFRHEGEELFRWLNDNNFQNLFLVCGDRHWQYHAQHPSGFEEFSTGALVDNNSRPGRLAGDPNSTDPEGLIKQFYIQGDAESASGGFLLVKVQGEDDGPIARFTHFDEKGRILYETKKEAVLDK
ncbi:MAG: alkaline phosphatase D family protein [Cyclobacteriaceae bacterium]